MTQHQPHFATPHTQLHQKMAIRTVVLNRYIEKCEVPNAKIFSIEDSSEEFELQDGQVLVETLFLSVDPYMRYKMMSDTSTFYLQPWKVAQPCYGGGVGVVIQSAANGLAAGDFVESFFWPWKTTCKVEGKLLNKVSDLFLTLTQVKEFSKFILKNFKFKLIHFKIPKTNYKFPLINNYR